MKNRKFLVPMAALLTAVATQQAQAIPASEDNISKSNEIVVLNTTNPFDFVLKRSDVSQTMSYHSSHRSHSSHQSHQSHYSSR